MADHHRHDGFIWALIFSLIINLLFVFALLIQRDGARTSGLRPFVVSIALNQQGHSDEHTVSIGGPPLPPPAKSKKALEPPKTLPPLHKNVQPALPTTDGPVQTTTPPPKAGAETAGTETDLPPLTTEGESAGATKGEEISGGLSIFGDKTAGDNYTAPEYLVGEKPPYPKQAERKGWAGTVILNLSINAKGEVEQVGIAKSSGYRLLDQQARQSVGAWRFKPARRNGIATAVTVQQPIIFRSTPSEPPQ
ncbi:MAG: energy transducer TonB [Desulfuromonadales bacterium]|nr:energy transducer TonB [Desulfuromonadales bacterium]